MRDAISILERCLQEGTEIITNEQVKELVGIPKLESVNKIINDILEYNIDDAIKTFKGCNKLTIPDWYKNI